MSGARLEAAGGHRYRLAGELSFATVTALYRQGLPAPEPGVELVLDLSAVGRGDSAGLALLVEWLKRARAAGGGLRLEAPPGQLARLIQVAGLGRAFGLPGP